MNRLKRLLALCLCLSMLLSLSACRYSSVLEQIIYDLMKGRQVDTQAEFQPEDNQPDNQETSDDLKDLALDEQAERVTQESPEVSTGEEDGGGAETEYRPDGEDELSAGVGETPAPSQETPEEGQAQPSYEAGAVQTWKQVVDAYGKQVDIPENVNQVAAVGEAAVMVMILDGAQRLAATNSGLTASAPIGGLAELAQVPALWEGDEDTPLSDSGFQRLLETAPDVLLEFSGSRTVTDGQAALLAEHGIAYLVLPAPTSTAQLHTIMTTLGTVLGDKSGEGGANAPQNAADYLSWVDSAASAVSQATASHAAYTDSESGVSVAGTYTLYVDGWDDDAYYRLYSDRYTTLSGYGCAVIRNGATVSCQTISSYLSLAHVVNTSAQYGIIPKTLYFTPLISAYRTMEVTGAAADGMVTSGQKLLEQTDGSLGTDNFPILVAADRHTAQAIAQSQLWQVYPHINSGDGSFNSDGFLDEEGNLVRTQISDDYEIVVNPQGLSSWSGGGAESILESVWAAWRFFGALSEGDVRGCISDFYSRFYHYSLSDSEIDRILEGK